MIKKCIPILLFALFMVSCKKDEGACTKNQFIGSWKGDVACSIAGSHQNVGVEITSGAGDKVIISDSIGGNFTNYMTDVELKQEGCKVSADTKVLGTGSLFIGDLSEDGQKLIVEFSSTLVGAEIERCKYTLSPK